MILLLDIGNTHTHLGRTDGRRILRHTQFPTPAWFDGGAERFLRKFAERSSLQGGCLCSVVPRATRAAQSLLRQSWRLPTVTLTHRTVAGIGIDYPHPETIGADRLANAVAVYHRYGAPAVVVDFGTAVTFDVVNRAGDYAGGIIAPGLAVMTGYLHEKTALLPRIRVQETDATIGRSTREAMLIGAVHGYRGLIKELLGRLRRELNCRRLPVVATGGYAPLIADHLREIKEVDPVLTLDGLRLVWNASPSARQRS